ncbi:hypothetical protein B4098_0055 [Heyndrickxia coagulans]|uniref:Uncharacterized protein n=1 Tax=Heyndrickxia coagulans TaxID=1398 RepID=A0A150JRH8_HEYCO|nr:hypothetical protein B4098_0055 [Heyndrickxia coagulans]
MQVDVRAPGARHGVLKGMRRKSRPLIFYAGNLDMRKAVSDGIRQPLAIYQKET